MNTNIHCEHLQNGLIRAVSASGLTSVWHRDGSYRHGDFNTAAAASAVRAFAVHC